MAFHNDSLLHTAWHTKERWKTLFLFHPESPTSFSWVFLPRNVTLHSLHQRLFKKLINDIIMCDSDLDYPLNEAHQNFDTGRFTIIHQLS